MEDYYKLLEVDNNASVESLNTAYKNKILEYKSLPFLTDIDKRNLKEIKKAYIVFNNIQYKKIYDNHLEIKNKNQGLIYNDINTKRKSSHNQNYLTDRIFSFQATPTNYNLKHNELLRPKNVGLSSDNVQEFDNTIDYNNNDDFKQYNNDDFKPYNDL